MAETLACFLEAGWLCVRAVQSFAKAVDSIREELDSSRETILHVASRYVLAVSKIQKRKYVCVCV